MLSCITRKLRVIAYTSKACDSLVAQRDVDKSNFSYKVKLVKLVPAYTHMQHAKQEHLNGPEICYTQLALCNIHRITR